MEGTTRAWRRAAGAGCALLLALLGGSASAHVGSYHSRPRAAPAPRFVPLPIGTPALASTACGSERTTDYTAHSPGSAPQVKVLYAYTANRGDHYAQLRDFIQRDVKRAFERLAAAPGSDKSLRLDLGTDCPAPMRYVDVQVVPLAQSGAYYGAENPGRLLPELQAAVAAQAASTKLHPLVFVDGVPTPNSTPTGWGTVVYDERPGPENGSNESLLFSYIFGLPDDGFYGAGAGSDGLLPLHEIFHALGAVQDGTPNSDHQTHCLDLYDLMCHLPAPGASAKCAGAGITADNPVVDCGGDDYFNPAPAAGGYLASHWNVYDSIYLCKTTECATDVAAPSAPPPAPAASALRGARRQSGTSVRFSVTVTGPGATVTARLLPRSAGNRTLARMTRRNVARGRRSFAVRLPARLGHGGALPARLAVRVELPGRTPFERALAVTVMRPL